MELKLTTLLFNTAIGAQFLREDKELYTIGEKPPFSHEHPKKGLLSNIGYFGHVFDELRQAGLKQLIDDGIFVYFVGDVSASGMVSSYVIYRTPKRIREAVVPQECYRNDLAVIYGIPAFVSEKKIFKIAVTGDSSGIYPNLGNADYDIMLLGLATAFNNKSE